jgi:hypothetical protein
MTEQIQRLSTDVEAPFPAFEGKPVDAVRVQASANRSAFDGVDTVMSVDDRVLVMAHYVCVGVSHEVDDKSGNLVRVQTLKPVEMHLHPWDVNDPTDDGVLRRNI